MEKNNITRLFEDVTLYEKNEFDLYTKLDNDFSIVDNRNLLKIYTFLGLLGDEKLITNCLICEERFAFTFRIRTSSFNDSSAVLNIGNDPEFHNVYLDFEEPASITSIKGKIRNASIKPKSILIDYYFSCTNKQEHEYYMRFVALKDNSKITFIKIGQFPENTSLGLYDSDTYKKVLRKLDDSYIDYKNSEKSFRRGLYVGAYDYLRRVYERMIRSYENKLTEEISPNSNMEERIKRISQFFDSRIRDYLYPLYSALSAGVHIMTEEECKEHYIDLKTIIDIQLQKIMSDEELDDQVEKSKKSLDLLNTKYRKAKFK